jgi:hypothetical protein
MGIKTCLDLKDIQMGAAFCLRNVGTNPLYCKALNPRASHVTGHHNIHALVYRNTATKGGGGGGTYDVTPKPSFIVRVCCHLAELS